VVLPPLVEVELPDPLLAVDPVPETALDPAAPPVEVVEADVHAATNANEARRSS
jgi:hypothetical protein